MTAKATFITILLGIIAAVAARDIPDFLHICELKNPTDYNTCVKQSIQFLQPYLKDGVPDYNIASVEPMSLGTINASPMNSMKIQVKDAQISGLSNYKIDDVKVDLKTLNMRAALRIPFITVEGKYDIDGKIFILPIKGSGPVHANFSDSSATLNLVSDRIIKDNTEYFHIKNAKINLAIGPGKLQFDNLLGDAAIGKVLNEAINNNLDLFMQNIIPPVEVSLSKTLLELANKIVMQFTLSQIFPD